MQVNCMTVKKCIFCKYWLGAEPDVDYLTGDCRYSKQEADCALNENARCTSDSVCASFTKAIRYM